MKNSTLKIVLFIAVLMMAQVLFAQNTPPNRPPPPPGLPIDGGILALFAVAFGYAIKKLKFKK